MVSNLSCLGVEEESKSDLQPWLLINDGEICHIQTDMFNHKPLLYDVGTEIPEVLPRNIGCSFGEWVLLTGGTYNNNNLPELLVNLLSKETIELPFLDSAYDFSMITSPPSDPTCHIVYFNQEENALIFCQPGDKKFTTKQWDYNVFPNGVRAAVAGKLFLTIPESSKFVMIEFKESTYRLEVLKMDSEIRFLGSDIFYFEYSGDLFAVYKMKIPSGFKICKADFLNKKWVGVRNLGTLAIFLGYETAHVQCASVESGIRANSIYFLERDDLDNYYIYNLEEGTVRMKPAFSSMEMEMETDDTELDWIMMHSDTSFPKLLKGDQETICQDSEKENKASGEVEEVGAEDSWNTVPLELLNLIQLHLFGRDNAVFRVACKAWQQVSIRDYSTPSIPPLLSATTLLELCQSFSPLLMFQEDITISDESVPIFRFLDPVHKKLYRTGIPELRETVIHYSKDGWLLVSRHGDESIFFFNPLTQEKIELPRMPSDSYFSSVAFSLSFSSLPTCSNCFVVGMHPVGKPVMYTLKHGEETWRRQEVDDFQSEDVRLYVHCPVMLNGLHHFMCENRDMVVCNLKDGVEVQLPACQSWLSKSKRSVRGEDFFLEINGGLAFVSVEPDGGEISFFKLNDLETDWELMEGGVDFGGKQMFLSKRGSFMEKIDDVGGLGNTIFVPMIDDAKEGVFYSLATQRYHTFYSDYSSELPYNVDKFLDGIWVKPDKKIVGNNNLKWSM